MSCFANVCVAGMGSCSLISRLVYLHWSITTFVNENQQGSSADKQHMIRQQDTGPSEALVLADSCMCAAHLDYSEPEEQDGKTCRLGIAGARFVV